MHVKNVDEIDSWGQFHQRFLCAFFVWTKQNITRKCAQIMCAKNVGEIDPCSNKNASVKRWWNWQQAKSLGKSAQDVALCYPILAELYTFSPRINNSSSLKQN